MPIAESEEAADLRVRRMRSADALFKAVDEHRDARRYLNMTPTSWAHPLRRVRERRVRKQARAVCTSAENEILLRSQELTASAAGAGETWGLLSQAGRVRPLTLEHVLWRIHDPRAQDLARSLPMIRAYAVRGHAAELLRDAERLVRELEFEHRVLHDFLPLHARDPHVSMTDLDRSTELLKLSVTERDGDSYDRFPHVYLHDIISRHRGSGMGTAALQELCAYADRRGLPILAVFVPGFTATDEDALRLACWYYRHGFRQETQTPEDWSHTVPMRRDPMR